MLVGGQDKLGNVKDNLNVAKKYKFNENAYKDKLNSSDKNFGNPLYSFSSYFELLEKKEDWINEHGKGGYSTTFPINDDKTMVEFRMFRSSIPLHYQNNLDNNDFENDGITINQMQKIITAYNNDIGKKGKKTKKNQESQNIEIIKEKQHIHFEKSSKKSERDKNKKIERKKRCLKGTRKNRLTGICEPKQNNKRNSKTKSKPKSKQSKQSKPRKRCPRGTRKNKKTGNCDKKT